MNYLLVDIRENNVLALRHFLLEGPEAWVPLKYELQKDDETAAGYVALLLGAFSVAVRRKFSPDYALDDIARFVDELRIKAEEEAVPLDLLLTEDAIRRAVAAPPLMKDSESDDELTTVLNTKVYVLLHLVAEADFTPADLEQFVEDVAAYTRDWIAAQRPTPPTYVLGDEPDEARTADRS
ncbi:hypothetical protein E1264_26440 [Actinomadura sp. KC216]|uniref:hypothetical protein n=1 Tax=Actinomadura sp. KC216 TaxID=2530370 RepID=UPI0010487B69|nr:hypothetical protein [Actinomadura sp. KC216]TDB83927.1 hypothetical protein E1264_26440 [Actinomadura sp. KC216]